MKTILKTMLLLVVLAAPIWAEVGKVVAAKGKIEITRDGKVVVGKTGTLIEEKDSINTGPKAKMQIMFNDKTIITLGKNSKFSVEEFSFGEKKDNKASFKFGGGAFRTITGKIGKLNPNKFKLKTKTATIGIRGTQFLGRLDNDSYATTEGEIEVTENETGESVNVPAGQITEVEPGTPPTPPRPYTPAEINSLAGDAGGGKAVMSPDEKLNEEDGEPQQEDEKKDEKKKDEDKEDDGEKKEEDENSNDGDKKENEENNDDGNNDDNVNDKQQEDENQQQTTNSNDSQESTTDNQTTDDTGSDNGGTTTTNSDSGSTPAVTPSTPVESTPGPTEPVVSNTPVEPNVEPVDEPELPPVNEPELPPVDEPDVPEVPEDIDVDNLVPDDTDTYIFITSGSVTNDSTPTISGTAEGGSTITVTINGETFTETVDSSGTFSFTASELVDAEYEVTASAIDISGNVASSTAKLTIDTQVSSLILDEINTISNSPTITGTTEAGATVVISLGDFSQTVIAGSDGSFSATFSGLTDESYSITAVATDGLGNTLDATSSLSIDVTAPSISFNDLVSNNRTPTISGTTEAGATIEVAIDGQVYSTVADDSGNFSLTTGELADDTYSVSATVTDKAGNSSDTTGSIIIDATAPNVSIESLTTNNNTPTISGTTEAGATVSVTVGGQSYATIADDSGNFSITTATLEDNSYSVTATATDDFGNSLDSTADLLIDTTGPTITLNSINTNNTTPVISGITEAGTTVEISVNGQVYTAVADNSGNFSVSLGTLEDNTYTITAQASDELGNISDASGSLTIDTIVSSLVVDTINTNSSTPTITGSTEAGATVTVTINGSSYTTVADDSGNFSISAGTLEDDSYTINASATDAVGNSIDSTGSLLIDTTAPTVSLSSIGTTSDATPTISGTTEPGAIVTVKVNGASYVTTADSSGSFSITTGSLNDNSYTAEASAIDSVGNSSAVDLISFVVNAVPDTPTDPDLAESPSTPDSSTDDIAVYLDSNDPYVSWGFWATESMSESTLDASKITSGWVSGDITPESTIEEYYTAGDTKTYSMSVKGLYQDTVNTYQAIGSGSGSISVSFGASTVGGSFSFSVEDHAGVTETWNATVDTGSISGSAFSSTISDAGAGDVTISSGNLQGAFYGPAANSVGGIFDMSESTGTKSVDGIFIGN